MNSLPNRSAYTPLVCGLNHRTAPLALRERLHFSADETPPALQDLKDLLENEPKHPTVELALISTCNRTELIGWCAETDMQAMATFLAQRAGQPMQDIVGHTYKYEGAQAVAHLMRLAAGLESMLAGENEILGQVKNAHALALHAGTAGPTLSAWFQAAIRCGKRARSETEIGCLRRSAAMVVVDLARSLFPGLENRTALLIGAGKISAMTARALAASGLRCILVANRTYERALKLADAVGGQAIHFDVLPTTLEQADIVICSTGAPHLVLHTSMVQAAQDARRRQAGSGAPTGAAPLLIVDLAVPRDADPQIGTLPGVTLIDIDGLEAQVQERFPLGAETRLCVEALVSQEVETFNGWLKTRRCAGLIESLKTHADEICAAQVEKTRRRMGDLSPDQRLALEAMAHAIAGRMLHAPYSYIKSAVEGDEETEVEAHIRQIFNLR